MINPALDVLSVSAIVSDSFLSASLETLSVSDIVSDSHLVVGSGDGLGFGPYDI